MSPILAYLISVMVVPLIASIVVGGARASSTCRALTLETSLTGDVVRWGEERGRERGGRGREEGGGGKGRRGNKDDAEYTEL